MKTMMYYNEENYKKGVELFKGGAHAVAMYNFEHEEVYVVETLRDFKITYKYKRNDGYEINSVSIH